jgi:plastocyanin
MKRRALGAAIASLALFTAACSGAAEDTAADGGGAAAGGDASCEPTSEPGSVLTGTVGTEEDPEAFEIALTDEAGDPVECLAAGDYTIEVSDPAEQHNFHLTGGSVDETTSVPETEEVTWEVTFEAGEYTFKCDPHPPMTGSFTVV